MTTTILLAVLLPLLLLCALLSLYLLFVRRRRAKRDTSKTNATRAPAPGAASDRSNNDNDDDETAGNAEDGLTSPSTSLHLIEANPRDQPLVHTTDIIVAGAPDGGQTAAAGGVRRSPSLLRENLSNIRESQAGGAEASPFVSALYNPRALHRCSITQGPAAAAPPRLSHGGGASGGGGSSYDSLDSDLSDATRARVETLEVIPSSAIGSPYEAQYAALALMERQSFDSNADEEMQPSLDPVQAPQRKATYESLALKALSPLNLGAAGSAKTDQAAASGSQQEVEEVPTLFTPRSPVPSEGDELYPVPAAAAPSEAPLPPPPPPPPPQPQQDEENGLEDGAMRIVTSEGIVRALISPDGTVTELMSGDVLAYIEEGDGETMPVEVGDPGMTYLGTAHRVDGDQKVVNAEGEIIGQYLTLRGGKAGKAGYVKDSHGKVIAEMGKDGEVRDHHGKEVGKCEGFTPQRMAALAAYLLLIDDDWLLMPAERELLQRAESMRRVASLPR